MSSYKELCHMDENERAQELHNATAAHSIDATGKGWIRGGVEREDVRIYLRFVAYAHCNIACALS